MTENTVSAGYVGTLLDLVATRGGDVQGLAEQSGLALQMLDDADARIPFRIFKALMRNAKRACDEPALGLHFGEETVISAMSIVGLICKSVGTMGEALHQMNRYARLIIEVEGHDFGDRFELKKRDGDLWLHDNRLNPNEFPELTESTFARLICASAKRVGDAPFAKSVHFTHAEPAHRAEYERIMKVPVTFGADRNALSIHESWLSIPTNLEDRYAFGIFSDRADGLLADLHKSKTTRGRVQSLLMPIVHTGNVGMDNIAGKLGQSRMSLYRRLKDEGTTFDRILDELRHSLAIHYLGSKKASVNEVAYLVGYSDPAAFSRAFKRWTGRSPNTAAKLSQ